MISILMATFNGEKYLAQQIDSLLTQTRQDFLLHITDDCSTDATFKIAKSYAARHPSKIIATQNETNSGDAKHNFLEMAAKIKDDYLMFCDQDDVWLPNKIEVTLAKMKELEAEYGPDMPLLVHTDAKVVGEDLQVINPSYREVTKRKYGRTGINQVLTLNNATGCTLMYNRALAEFLSVKPRFCAVHDWWLQIVAAYFGKIGSVYEPTVLYRQHGGNSIGAKDVRTLSYKIRQAMNYSHIKSRISQTYLQAESLLENYKDKLSPEHTKLIKAFIDMPKKSKLKRWYTICNQKLFMDGLSRNVAYFLFV